MRWIEVESIKPGGHKSSLLVPNKRCGVGESRKKMKLGHESLGAE